MARVLVLTKPGDLHTLAVKAAMTRYGHEIVLWHTADFPTRENVSMTFNASGATRWSICGPDMDFDQDTRFDVVWWRRPVPPTLSGDELHPADLEVARRESTYLADSIRRMIAPTAFWVNPIRARDRARLKPLQLQAAIDAGLTIPPTLISNDPQEIRRYLTAHERVVYKSFYPAFWYTAREETASLFTSEVDADDLPEDDVLRCCPGIFQPRIDKQYELRVTCMGGKVIPAKLLSQDVPTAMVDSRRGGLRVPIEPCTLPLDVADGCREVMRSMGLTFACFDFIVTPAGNHVFLELNEAGQFLWPEEVEPSVRLLGPFCHFLASRGSLSEPEGFLDVGFGEFKDSLTSEIESSLADCRHVIPDVSWGVRETHESGTGGSGIDTVDKKPDVHSGVTSDNTGS